MERWGSGRASFILRLIGLGCILVVCASETKGLKGKKKRNGEEGMGDGEEQLPWHMIKQQMCNIGMQDKYKRPIIRPTNLAVTCGVLNEDMDLDFTGKPCCCNFCGQRDPFGQLCEISKQICTSVSECIQRHHGQCVEVGVGGGIERFHAFWILVIGGLTAAPFVLPVLALAAAEDIVLGLAG